MVKNNALATVVHESPRSDEVGASVPTPGHTDDEASDEEGGDVSEDDRMGMTMEHQPVASPTTRQDDVAVIFSRGRLPLCWPVGL